MKEPTATAIPTSTQTSLLPGITLTSWFGRLLLAYRVSFLADLRPEAYALNWDGWMGSMSGCDLTADTKALVRNGFPTSVYQLDA
jgi:hypothetical protein